MHVIQQQGEDLKCSIRKLLHPFKQLDGGDVRLQGLWLQLQTPASKPFAAWSSFMWQQVAPKLWVLSSKPGLALMKEQPMLRLVCACKCDVIC